MSIEPLGSMIRRRRLNRNLSQDQLAQLAGISRRHLSLIERGTANLTMDVLVRLANILGMDEVYVRALRVSGAPLEVTALVDAGDAVDRALRTVMDAAHVLTKTQREIDDLIRQYSRRAGEDDRIREAARHLEATGSDALADAMKEIAATRELPSAPPRRPAAQAARPARRRAR